MTEEIQASQRRIGLTAPSSPIYARALSFLQSDTCHEIIHRERKSRKKSRSYV